MNSQLQKQILLGALVGILVSALIWFLLGGQRDEIKALDQQILAISQEVDKGNLLKQNAEKLKAEIAQQEKRIDELIKVMPSDQDRGELPYRIKKLADTAGIDQMSFGNDNPNKKEFYTEFPVRFDFRAGYHSFGQFASLISGYEKIINLTDVALVRDTSTRGVYSTRVTCRVTAFVYNAGAGADAAPKPAAAPAPKPAGGKSKGEGE